VIEIVPGNPRVELQTPYLRVGATRLFVLLATSSATNSGCMLSVERGRCSPCSSTLPTGNMMATPVLAAFSASFMLSSSNHRCSFFFGFVFVVLFFVFDKLFCSPSAFDCVVLCNLVCCCFEAESRLPPLPLRFWRVGCFG